MNNELLKKLKERFNGSEIMANLEKKQQEDFVGENLTIKDYDVINGSDSHFYAVVFKEHDDNYVLSGSALTELIDMCESEDYMAAVGIRIRIGKKVKTKNKTDYTPITVL